MPQDSPPTARALYTSDEGGEFSGLYSMDFATGKSASLLLPNWDVDAAADFDRSPIPVRTVNVDGTVELALQDLSTGRHPPAAAAVAGGGCPPRSHPEVDIWALASHRRHAADAVRARSANREARKLDDPLPPSLADADGGRGIGAGPSFDGRQVPGFSTARRERRVPAIIDVHGGPTSQSCAPSPPIGSTSFPGIAVFVPNVADDGLRQILDAPRHKDLGGGPLKDIVAAKWWLVATLTSRTTRRWSWRKLWGYMALAARRSLPRNSRHVDFFGVSDLKTLWSFPPYWAAFATFIYQKFGDPRTPRMRRTSTNRSPIHFVGQMKRPSWWSRGITTRGEEGPVRPDRRLAPRAARAVHYLVLQNEGTASRATTACLRAMQATDAFIDR